MISRLTSSISIIFVFILTFSYASAQEKFVSGVKHVFGILYLKDDSSVTHTSVIESPSNGRRHRMYSTKDSVRFNDISFREGKLVFGRGDGLMIYQKDSTKFVPFSDMEETEFLYWTRDEESRSDSTLLKSITLQIPTWKKLRIMYTINRMSHIRGSYGFNLRIFERLTRETKEVPVDWFQIAPTPRLVIERVVFSDRPPEG